MKKIISLFIVVILISSCSFLKKSSSKEDVKTEQTQDKTKKDKQENRDKTLSDKERKKQREKEAEQKRKEQAAEQKRLKQEYDKKKKEEEKLRKQKEKEQENIIRNAAKAERQRIKEERKKEKETLLSEQKLAEQEAKEQERIEKELEKQEQQRLIEEEKLEKELAKREEQERKDSIREAKRIEKEQKAAEQERLLAEQKAKEEEEKQRFDNLSTMDQIIYRMQNPDASFEEQSETKKSSRITNSYTTQEEEDIVALSEKEKKKILAAADDKENFFKRTYKKVFPEKTERWVAYPRIYQEKPLTIMVMYPWNRSDYPQASKMAYVSCVKNLGEKGYYVLPALPMADELQSDSTQTAQYINTSDLQHYKEKYNADAILLMTIYRVEKPWWSTNINVVAHYDLISTKTNDTLFSRHADFNYDTPMPTKEKINNNLVKDPETSLYLGLFEQMQKYVLLDMPFGPYHQSYNEDRKKSSQPQEMKYKVNIKPS